MSEFPHSADIDAPPSRRSYLGWLIGLCAAGVAAALSVPLARFALYPLTSRPTEKQWSDAGAVVDFGSIGAPVQCPLTMEERDGWRETLSDKVVYVTKDSAGHLRVLSAICPHLGCSVQWIDSAHHFVCPCHGASFAPDGTRLAGPSPRGMDSLDTLIRDGRLMVRYQYFRQLVPAKEVIG